MEKVIDMLNGMSIKDAIDRIPHCLEVKFRQKGEIVTRSLSRATFKERIEVPDVFGGIDLTNWKVVWMHLGKGGREIAQEFSQQHPDLVVVYEFNYRLGFGEGVFLPQGFKPKNYYLTAAQILKAEYARVEGIGKTFERKLEGELDLGFPVNIHCWPVTSKPGQMGLTIRSAGKAYVLMGWDFNISLDPDNLTPVEEIRQAVAPLLQEWKEWDDRAIALYRKVAQENNWSSSDPKEQMEIYPCPKDSVSVVGIKLHYYTTFRIFERKDGEWIDTGKWGNRPSS